jgi:methyl coenzyme M reductase subunit C
MNEELKKEILDILDNVYYWESCPQDYNDRIDEIKKKLNEQRNSNS